MDTETEEWVKKNGKEFFDMPKRDDETFEEYKKRLSGFINRD